jgi:hypothetical protein
MKQFVRAFLVVTALLPASRALADTAILKGLPATGFAVLIDPLDPETRKAGITELGLRKVIETRMLKRKIPVAPAAGGQLFVRIVMLTSNDVTGKVLGYGAHLELSFREKALLKRDKATEFMAPVWFKGAVTVSNPKSIVTEVVVSLASLTDQFLNDYQHENPSKL